MSAGFLLDTVVLSELRKGDRAHGSVLAWQRGVDPERCYVSVISLLEVRQGIRSVRRTDAAFAARLDVWYRNRLLPRFRDHILEVDQPAAEAAAALAERRTFPPYDLLLAGTASARGLVLVTRNVGDFEGSGLPLVNPWEGGQGAP